MISSSSMIRIVVIARNTPVILYENGIPEPGTGAPHRAGREDQVFPAVAMKKS
jgi:hypothetical protein